MYTVKLYSSNGFFLALKPDGHVLGTYEDDNNSDSEEDTTLQIISTLAGGLVQIQGLKTKLYVCFDLNTGRVYGEADNEHRGTLFLELQAEDSDAYVNYRAQERDWYISIRGDGKIRCGDRSTRTDGKHLRERRFLKKILAGG